VDDKLITSEADELGIDYASRAAGPAPTSKDKDHPRAAAGTEARAMPADGLAHLPLLRTASIRIATFWPWWNQGPGDF